MFSFKIAIFALTMVSFITFLISKREKASKSGSLEKFPSWYISSLNPSGKGVCKRLIHLSSSSFLKIFFNLLVELDLCIIFSTPTPAERSENRPYTYQLLL